MKKILFLISLGCLLPFSQAWGLTTYYYAKIVVNTSSNSTGLGKVYAGSSATSGGSWVEGSTSYEGKTDKEGGAVSLGANAQANDYYEFAGWSSANNGSIDLGTTAAYNTSISTSKTSVDSTVTKTIYANFRPATIASFDVTFQAPQGGSYTVDGAAVGGDGLTVTKTQIYKPALVMTGAEPGNAFVGWYEGDTKISSDPNYTATFVSTHTIGPKFVSAHISTTLADLQSSVQSNPLTEVPSGTTIVIPSGQTVTVGSGNTLIINGTVWVVGTLNGSAGSVTVGGAVCKVVKSIVQSDPITPENAYTTYPSYKYCTTQISPISATVSGCTVSSYGVSVGGKYYAINASDPNALKVTFDTTKAVNSIASVDNATISGITVNGSYLLLKDTSMTGPVTIETAGSSTYNRINFQGTVDCAGSKCTVSGKQVGATYNATVVNGSFVYDQSSYYWQSGKVKFINCSAATVKRVKYSVGNEFYFYDCGTVAKPMSITTTYYSTARGTDRRFAYYYSGCFSYTFNSTDDGSGLSKVYGGVFTSNPNDYLAQATLIAKQSSEHNNYYLVRVKQPGDDVVMIGDVGYTSLQAAVDAATSGARLKVNNAIELTDKVTIASGKNLIIDLSGLNISGGSIENSGVLRLEDTSNGDTKGTLSSPVTNKGSGTIDINRGIYAGSFAINGGTMKTHAGSFTSTFSVTKSGSGAYHLLGGYFANDVKALLDSGYRQVNGKVGYYFEGSMVEATIGSAQIGYKTKALSPDKDYELYQKYLKGDQSGSKYSTVADWDRVVEIESAVQPYEGLIMDCTLSFDRNVAANTITGYGMAKGMTQSISVEQAVKVGEMYRILRPVFKKYGGGDKSYKYFFIDDDLQNVGFGVSNNSTALENIGTTCTMAMRLFDGYTDALILTIASRTYKFSGNGAIYGSTDYTSLSEALTKAGYAGEVRLSKDCAETITVSATKTFIIDKNNFNFTGSVAGGTGYQVATTDLGSGKTQYAVTPITYNITYYDGETVLDLTPKTYTVETATFNLPTPEKTGYTFAGWYDNAELTGSAVTTITKGTTGAKKLYSKWTAITYNITYTLNGGTNHADNPKTYTIESETITLKDPTKTDYNFTGWTPEGVIAKGSTGDKTFTAGWELALVTITIPDVAHMTKEIKVSDGEATLVSGTTYQVKPGVTVTVTYTAATGYEPTSKVCVLENASKGATIPDVPTATAIEYTITYNLNGGKNNADNPATYTIESETITLKDPTKTDSSFLGWTPEGVITAGSTGDKTFEASWKLEYVRFTVEDVANTTKEVVGETELVSGNTYKAAPDADITVTYTANEGYYFENGDKVEVKVKAAAGIKITTEPPTRYAAKIGATYYKTLGAALAEVAAGQTVEVQKDLELSTPIAIESTTPVYTLDLNNHSVTGELELASGRTIAIENPYLGTFFTVTTADKPDGDTKVPVTTGEISPIFFQSWTNTYWATTNDAGHVALAAASETVSVKDVKGKPVKIEIPKKWRDEQKVTGEEAMRTEQPMQNGLTAWQNYALGIDPTNELSGVYADAPQNPETDTVKVVVQNLDTEKIRDGYSFAGYRLESPDGSVVTNETESTFNINLKKDNPNGLYRLCTVVEKDNHELIVETVNTVGLIKQTQAVTNAIISVPWGKLAPGYEDIAVSNVVKTATLDEGDELRVYRPGQGRKYESWKLKANKEWEPGGIVDEKGNVIKSAEPQVATIPKGSGIWLCRKDPSKPYYLYGQADSTESAVELEKGANLVGATGTEAYDINAHITGAQAGDTITVPGTNDVPMAFSLKDGKWGRWASVKGKTVKDRHGNETTYYQTVWETNAVVRPGTGFWLHNNSGKVEVK